MDGEFWKKGWFGGWDMDYGKEPCEDLKVASFVDYVKIEGPI